MIKDNGYTLIELLFVLGVFSALCLFSMSSLTGLRQRNEEQILLDEMRVVIQFAKVQAVNLNQPLYLTALNSNWSEGIALFRTDYKSLKKTLVQQWSWKHPSWDIAWSGVNGDKQIIISADIAQSMSNGRFILNNTQTTKQIVLTLNRLGRIKIKQE